MRVWPGLIWAFALAWPVAAQADWTHKPSGVSLPETVGAMQHGEERDLSEGKALDVSVQYGSASEPVTLWVYRGSHPNPALWFERTRHAMIDNVGAFDPSTPPRAFAVGGASAPNGLREEYPITADGPWKSTAVAMAQVGEWMVKARITSQTLDKAGVARQMDGLLAALRFAKPAGTPLPLTAPIACDGVARLSGKQIKADKDAVAAGVVEGVVAMLDARGKAGLALEPAKWCRSESSLPAKHVSLYRRLDGGGWVALLGDAGLAVSSNALLTVKGRTGVYASNARATSLVGLFDADPSPEDVLGAALPVLMGQSNGMGSVSVDAPAT